MPFLFEHWEDEVSTFLVPVNGDREKRHRDTLVRMSEGDGLKPKLCRTIEAETWAEAMDKHYEHLGFGKYTPIDEDATKPYVPMKE